MAPRISDLGWNRCLGPTSCKRPTTEQAHKARARPNQTAKRNFNFLSQGGNEMRYVMNVSICDIAMCSLIKRQKRIHPRNHECSHVGEGFNFYKCRKTAE